MTSDKSDKYEGDSKEDIDSFIDRNTLRALGIEFFIDKVENYFGENEEKDEEETYQLTEKQALSIYTKMLHTRSKIINKIFLTSKLINYRFEKGYPKYLSH